MARSFASKRGGRRQLVVRPLTPGRSTGPKRSAVSERYGGYCLLQEASRLNGELLLRGFGTMIRSGFSDRHLHFEGQSIQAVISPCIRKAYLDKLTAKPLFARWNDAGAIALFPPETQNWSRALALQ